MSVCLPASLSTFPPVLYAPMGSKPGLELPKLKPRLNQ